MVEEKGELELGDGLPEGKLQEPYYNGECVKWSRMSRKDALAALI